MTPKRYTTKELAAVLRHSRGYVQAMKARGFTMPGGTATLEDARAWLAANPKPLASCPPVPRRASRS